VRFQCRQGRGGFKCGTLLAPLGEEDLRRISNYVFRMCEAAINTRLILTLVVAILGVALITAGVMSAKNAE
jgi:hypothetical protein